MQNYMSNGKFPYNNGNSIPPQQSQYSHNIPTNPAPNPNYAGVNIQIINPMVNPGGSNGYIYPQQVSSAYDAGTNGGCYPSGYYTTQPGSYALPPQNPYGHIVTQQNYPTSDNKEGVPTNNQNVQQPAGFYDNAGNYYPYVNDKDGNIGYYDKNGQFHKMDSAIQTGNTDSSQNTDTSKNGVQQDAIKEETSTENPAQQENIPKNDENSEKKDNAGEQTQKSNAEEKNTNSDNNINKDNNTNSKTDNNKNGFYDNNGKFHEYTKDENGNIGYKDENGQFHKLDPNDVNYPKNNDANINSSSNQSNSNNQNTEQTSEKTVEKNDEQKKTDGKTTETRTVVVLSNDYIKTLENYLNSQDLEVRKMGAHEVVDRIIEDPARKDDPALTALVNKMLQDPSGGIRAIALSLIESRAISGDNLTVKLLKNMQKNNDGFGLDATQATNALLKMSGKTVEKEVEIPKDKKKNEKETDNNKQVK